MSVCPFFHVSVHSLDHYPMRKRSLHLFPVLSPQSLSSVLRSSIWLCSLTAGAASAGYVLMRALAASFTNCNISATKVLGVWALFKRGVRGPGIEGFRKGGIQLGSMLYTVYCQIYCQGPLSTRKGSRNLEV